MGTDFSIKEINTKERVTFQMKELKQNLLRLATGTKLHQFSKKVTDRRKRITAQ